MKDFKSAGVIVFADTRKDGSKLPAGAVKMRNSPKAGNVIPMVLVTTADGQKGLEAINYATLKSDTRKAARNLRKSLEGVDVVGNGAPAAEDGAGNAGEAEDAGDEKEITTESGLQLDVLIEEQEWTNSGGKKIRAAVLAVENGVVTFLLPGQKTVEYPLTKLSAASRDAITRATEDE